MSNEKDQFTDKNLVKALSPFARFCVELRGYLFYKGKRVLDRWELFESGYLASDILSGKAGIKAVPTDYPPYKHFR